jgi:hypothetical protein
MQPGRKEQLVTNGKKKTRKGDAGRREYGSLSAVRRFSYRQGPPLKRPMEVGSINGTLTWALSHLATVPHYLDSRMHTAACAICIILYVGWRQSCNKQTGFSPSHQASE